MNAEQLHAILQGEVDEAVALTWHLGNNHYPPVPPPLWRFAARAIVMLGSDEEVVLERYDNGMAIEERATLNGRGATARELADGYHLWDFIQMRQSDDVLPPDEEEVWHDARAAESG